MKTVCLRLSDLIKYSFDCMSIIERELFFTLTLIIIHWNAGIDK